MSNGEDGKEVIQSLTYFMVHRDSHMQQPYLEYGLPWSMTMEESVSLLAIILDHMAIHIAIYVQQLQTVLCLNAKCTTIFIYEACLA